MQKKGLVHTVGLKEEFKWFRCCLEFASPCFPQQKAVEFFHWIWINA